MNATTTAEKQKPLRRPGRPRVDGRPQISREDVYWVTAKLMSQNGFSGTSIRMIADQLNAGPASIFNLFKSKGEILNDLAEWACKPIFTFHQELLRRDDAPTVALFKSVYEEALTIASLDRDYPAVFYLPELRQPGFERAAAMREQMITHYRILIENGIRAGMFIDVEPTLAAEQSFQLTETSVHAADCVDAIAPPQIAQASASFCLRALLVEPHLLPQIEDAAVAIPLTIEMYEPPS